MAVQFFGETGPIRVPFRTVDTSESAEEPVSDPRDHDLPSPGKQVTGGKRLPKHRAMKAERIYSH